MEGKDVLKRERMARGFSIEALGVMIGKSGSAIAQFESGRTGMLRDTALALDEALNTGHTIAAAFGFASSPVDVVELQRQVDELREQVRESNQRWIDAEALPQRPASPRRPQRGTSR